MIEFKAAKRIGNRIQRQRQAVELGTALRVLSRFYEGCGVPLPEVGALIGEEIERCLTGAPGGRERLQGHLHLLLRARDMHLYMMEPEALIPLKMTVLEHLLFHQDAASRWAAVREVLAAGMDTLCQSPWPGRGANPERGKEALSDRRGQLGRLLTLVALFNLELEENGAPSNALLHFKRGDFPLHHWEFSSRGGHQAHGDAPAGWRPENPLCRQEFLGLDLFHTLLRRNGGGALAGAGGPLESGWLAGVGDDVKEQSLKGQGGEAPAGNGLAEDGGAAFAASAPHLGKAGAGDLAPAGDGNLHRNLDLESNGTGPDGQQPGRPQQLVFCRLEGRGATGNGQLELFPFDPDTFSAGLLALVHRRLGPEGVKILALIMGRVAEFPPEAPFELDGAAIAAAASLNDLSSRGVAARLRRLHRVMEMLGGVELTRISREKGKETVHGSRLVAVVGQKDPAPTPEGLAAGEENSGDPGQQGDSPSGTGGTGPVMRIVADQVLQHAGGAGLPRLFQGMPEFLCAAGGKHHPYLIPLYAYLRRCWGGNPAPEVLERGIEQLIAEAGLWVSPTGRYRALESIKADLNLLLERGCLGEWRMKRAVGRDGREHRFMLYPPKPDVRPEPAKGGGWADTG